jgi:Mrp family chromosome partitioning ATPase
VKLILKLDQVVPITAAVIVTTPQKLAFIDVAKGVQMFSRLKVPSIAVVENMCYFEGDGKRYYPFGQGSGAQVCYITVHWVHKIFQRNDSCFLNRR